ncbi:probable beta-tubulin polyglutamylase isoform X2 [Aricia agestis]|uniref:probable beta-tubulin polyglutamylase isoform X2 n=1 Tax=Aricia agestis TaxID=91739 RepID=UPI001C204051|nr:probable beta-tubulin polyglutamylase isoform X2 [Aricia agestis]
MGKVFLPHVSETTAPSTSGQRKPNSSMRQNEEAPNNGKENQEAAADWIVGGPVGARGAVLVFRSCVLATKAPPDSAKPENHSATGTTILLNKAKNMAKRLVSADPNSINIKQKNIMHEVMETFGSNNKYTGQAYIVKHASDGEQDTVPRQDAGGQDKAERKRNIEDVLNDLNKITLKKNNLTKQYSTPSIKYTQEAPPREKDGKDENKYTKNSKAKTTKKMQRRDTLPAVEANDWENMVIKDVDHIKVLDSSDMPARTLRIKYKLVNTETKLLHRLLQAHGLLESTSDSKEFNLMWSGLHPKPDVLRALLPYQRVNHFPRSYELTRKDKLFKNIEKMQYFRGYKNFDFIPTSFLMPTEYKELCTTHYRTKGPWIVKPAASSRGRGIYIVNTPEQIPKDENVVVAKYIDKPLLIGGHKCDLRLYVCVTSIDPLLIYLYEEGLVRFATVKYDNTNKNLWNPCMHLCNYSINKYHTDYIKCSDATAGNVGHKWTLSALLRHLRAAGRDTAALMAAIEDLVVKSVLAGAHTITAAARVFVPHTFNCFELFGYDILIDDMLKPWLLEINLSPSLACESPLDARVKSALLADTLTLVGLPAVPAAPRDAHRPRAPQGRRVHSAEAVGRGAGTGAGAGLTSEERRLVRAVRAQYARRGGFVRIFPSQNSWQKYSQYLDPVSGVPMCSTSLGGGAGGAGGGGYVQRNHNLLVHAHVLPHFHDAAAPTDTPERLKRYETVSIAGAAPAVQLSDAPPRPVPPRDIRHAKELIKRQLASGLRLTAGEGRRLFGLYLTHVLKRLSRAQDGAGGGAGSEAALVLRFLRRASGALRTPYRVRAPPPTMCDKDRCAVVASHLNDFLYMYCRETDLYTDSDDDAGCVPNIHFAQFLYAASEADLEEVLLAVLRADKYVATFLDDGRGAALSVDLPPARRAHATRPDRPALLRLLAALTHRNCRRYRSDDEASETSTRSDPDESSAQDSESAPVESAAVLKHSLLEEKPLNEALKYAKS